MNTSYLIDGYNLLHAIGYLTGKVGPGELEKARLRLLHWLHEAFGPQSTCVTVVFDAAGARRGARKEEEYHGVNVRYALGGQQADDLIEQILLQESAPKFLTMVSDDHRLQQAARRRHAKVLGCGDFLDVVEGLPGVPPPGPAASPEKKENMSDQEKQQWLDTFGDLEKDPEFKDLFEEY